MKTQRVTLPEAGTCASRTARWTSLRVKALLLCFVGASLEADQPAPAPLSRGEAHVWDVQEITMQAAKDHPSPYADVVCWIDLEGPGYSRRVYGFCDGGRTFRVRFVATATGEWRWRSGSNQPADTGLNGGSGALPFPGGSNEASQDWAAKLTASR